MYFLESLQAASSARGFKVIQKKGNGMGAIGNQCRIVSKITSLDGWDG